MTIETELAAWAVRTRFEDIPEDVVEGMKLLTRTVIGTTVAGATSYGCTEVIDLVRSWGGAEEATIWVHGGKVPAHAASLANSTMARALDICDAAVPGQHIGTSAVPVAMAMAELAGGVDGRAFLTALAVGAEIATRLGLVSRLDGFDPTGACSIFAPCIIAGRLLNLDADRMHQAMALTFNKAGSSFQSNVDASLAVRVIQGFVSQDAVLCAQLAKRGITGPANWLTGVWGYFHLFCKDEHDEATLRGGLGEQWHVRNFGYKTRPQCGATISSTDAIFDLLGREPFRAEEVERIDIHMANEGPCSLVGSGFTVGAYPQVNGQFNVRYCVANAIVRGSSRLHHFTAEAVADPIVGALARRIETHLKPELMEGRRELAARVAIDVRLTDGRVLTCGANGPSGFPPFPKTPDRHLADFREHVAYGGRPLSEDAAERVIDATARLDTIADVRDLLPLFVAQPAYA